MNHDEIIKNVPIQAPTQSLLLWHIVIWKPSKDEKNYETVKILWESLRRELNLTDEKNALVLPTENELRELEGYKVIAYSRDERLANYNYAHIYVQHDVLGICVVLQSTIEITSTTFEQHENYLLAESRRISALWTFINKVSLNDKNVVPVSIQGELSEKKGFTTKQNFILWRCKPRQKRVIPLFTISLPDEDSQSVLKQELLGPNSSHCPIFLAYQVNSAKVHYLTEEFGKVYRDSSKDSPRQSRKQVEADLDSLLNSNDLSALVIPLEQQKQSRLTIMRCDLQHWLITLQIAKDNLEWLQPRPLNDSTEVFALYRSDRDYATGLRGAIQAELDYTNTTIERLKALQLDYSARIEKARLDVQDRQLKIEKARLHHNLLQGSIISGITLGLTAIQASAEYHYPELRWPLVVFFFALGFVLPILAFHMHFEKLVIGKLKISLPTLHQDEDQPQLNESRVLIIKFALSLLFGSFISLLLSYSKEMWKSKPHWQMPPLFDIWLYGIISFLLAFIVLKYVMIERSVDSKAQNETDKVNANKIP